MSLRGLRSMFMLLDHPRTPVWNTLVRGGLLVVAVLPVAVCWQDCSCCLLRRCCVCLFFVYLCVCFFVGCLCVCLFLSLLLVSLIFVCLFLWSLFLWFLFVCLFVCLFFCLFVCLFVCLHSCLEGFWRCSVIIESVLVVFLVVFIDVSTPRSRMVTPPLPHTPHGDTSPSPTPPDREVAYTDVLSQATVPPQAQPPCSRERV